MVDYWTRIASDGDFLGPPPSYTLIKELLRKLCHHLITFTNFDKGQSPEKACLGEKGGSLDVGWSFYCTTWYTLWVITEQSLQNLTVEVRDLPTIDPEELIKLRICKRVLDIVSWVAEGPPRQQGGAAGGGAEIDPEAAAAAPKIIAQRLQRVEVEVQQMNVSLGEQHVMIEGWMSEHARYSTWMVDRMTKLMESRGMRYERFDSSIAPDTHLHFERRRVRHRIDVLVPQLSRPRPSRMHAHLSSWTFYAFASYRQFIIPTLFMW
ncbi:hypothetical protein Tco_0416958 [Tanacetum coccineum]